MLLRPMISIIMPSFNQGEYIEQSILSVLRQDYESIVFILVDGGSKDNTSSIIETYRSNIDIVIQEPDNGQADAINKGLIAASGDIVGWLNSDDILYPGSISLVADLFSEIQDIGVIYGNVDSGPSEFSVDRIIRGEAFSFLDAFRRLDVPMPQQGCFWKRSAMESSGLLDERWHFVLDRDFFIRLSDKERCLYVNHSFGLFRVQPNSKSSGFASSWIVELEKLYSSYFTENTFEHNIKPYEAEVMAASSFAGLLIALRAKLPFVALRLALKVLVRDPLFVFHPYFISRTKQFLNRLYSFVS